MEANQTVKAQIKEMAEKLGLSTTTVSVVLNGRGDDLRIAKATQQRIMDLAKEMNYQPNIYARRLRKAASETAPMVISVFWRIDNLNIRLGKYLKGLYEAIEEQGCRAEIVVQPYEAGCFEKHVQMLNSFRCSGAMISGLTEEEQTDLENRDFTIPIILIGRKSSKFHSVMVDNHRTGYKCGQNLISKGTKSAAFIGFQKGGAPEHHMKDGFMECCRSQNVIVKEDWNLKLEKSSFEIGYQAASTLLAKLTLPSAWLVMDSRLSGGILAACKELQVKVPSDLKIMFLEESEMLKYNMPSLSSVDLPIGEMAKKALDILMLVSKNKIDIPIERELLPIYHLRESSKDTNSDIK